MQLWASVIMDAVPTGHGTSTASFFKDISKYQGKSKASRVPVAQSYSSMVVEILSL